MLNKSIPKCRQHKVILHMEKLTRKQHNGSQARWNMPVITAPGKLKQENCEIEASLGYNLSQTNKKPSQPNNNVNGRLTSSFKMKG
jgi:hypothetical protein